jgi:DNA-binding MarR family transcriptional regulator
MLDIKLSTIASMATLREVTYPEFEDLLLFCNRLFGRLDGELKKSKPRLTITGLQVLTQIAKNREIRQMTTQARVAEAIGLTPSSLVTTVRGLEANGLIVVDRNGYAKTHALSLTPAGRAALYRGLVVREDVLKEFREVLPSKYRRQFLLAARLANRALDVKRAGERQDRYLKSLKKHETRKVVRRVRQDT